MIKNISNLGDTALYCDFGNEVNKSINSQVIKYFKTIKEKKVKGINNLTPSYNKLIISYDLRKTNFNEVKKYITASADAWGHTGHRRPSTPPAGHQLLAR